MEPESSLPLSQEPPHLSLSWARSIRSMPSNPAFEVYFSIILPSTSLSSKLSLSHRSPHHRPLCTYPLPPYVLQAPPISFFLIWSAEWHLARSTDHEALRYVIFSTPLLPIPSKAQIYSLAASSGTPPTFALPSMWETTLHTHIELLYVFGQ